MAGSEADYKRRIGQEEKVEWMKHVIVSESLRNFHGVFHVYMEDGFVTRIVQEKSIYPTKK